jgi:hypothetical protein
VSDLTRWEDAVKTTPRGPTEKLEDWLKRVAGAARPVNDRELPRGDREPGDDE